jgi:hypothetical protein
MPAAKRSKALNTMDVDVVHSRELGNVARLSAVTLAEKRK